jgi:hypothetical protein
VLVRERKLDVDTTSTRPATPTRFELDAHRADRDAGQLPGQDLMRPLLFARALQSDERIAATLDACFEAGIDFVSLPTVNMFLQDRRAGRTPRWRGVPPLQEMRARGLRVAIARDNARNPFYAYGDHDMLDTFTQAVKIVQLDYPLGDWITAATRVPAAIMGLTQRGTLQPGTPADLASAAHATTRNCSPGTNGRRFPRRRAHRRSGVDADAAEDEGVVECALGEGVVAAGCAAVSGAHVDLHEDRLRARRRAA